MTHICISKLTIIGLDNGLSPGWCQAIIWTNTGILLIEPLGTNVNEILIKIYTFALKKMDLKISSGKWRPSCLGLNVLTSVGHITRTQPPDLLYHYHSVQIDATSNIKSMGIHHRNSAFLHDIWLDTGRGIGTEACRLDRVFPPHDLWFG